MRKISLPSMLSASSGFTLIELVAVVVLLGILAVTALPRFVALRSDAIIASMQGIRGAIESASSLTYARAVIDGIDGQPAGSVVVDGVTIDTVYGYPAGTATGIVRLIDYSAGDWNSRVSSFPGAWVYWHGVIDEDAFSAQCFIRYRQSTAPGVAPRVDFESGGC